MTILVAGAGGQVGRALQARAGAREMAALAHAQWDIADDAATARVFARHRPAVVINAAAYTAVDRAESEPEAACAANRDGVAGLAWACAASNVPLLHVSTCYVFGGDLVRPYTEDDAPAPLNVYGRSKLAGEHALRQRWARHITLRVSWVFGAHGGNFPRTMLKLARDGRPLRVVADQYGTPTHAGAVADALLALADRILGGEALPWGTYHYTGGPALSWHAYAQAIVAQAHALGLLAHVPAVDAISSADYPCAARRPAYTVLDASRAQRALGLRAPDWRDGLREVLSEWKHAS